MSEKFDVKMLVTKILKEMRGDENYSDFSMKQLQSHLRNELDGKKFLFVFDDVWN